MLRDSRVTGLRKLRRGIVVVSTGDKGLSSRAALAFAEYGTNVDGSQHNAWPVHRPFQIKLFHQSTIPMMRPMTEKIISRPHIPAKVPGCGLPLLLGTC